MIPAKYLNSNRSGHLFANAISTATIAAISIHQQSLFLAGMAATCWATETLISPDMDHNSRKIKGSLIDRLWLTYWRPYALLVPHRGMFSHSLLIGTPCRLGYAIAPIVLLAAINFPDVAIGMLRQVVDDPVEVLGWASQWDWIIYGAWVSDAVHLAKDRYKPWRWILG